MTGGAAHPRLRLAELFEAGAAQLQARYGTRLGPEQRQAMAAIRACGSGALGQIDFTCTGCGVRGETPRSCGHRSCPACQNHTTTQWLERQRSKLLPVDYVMVSFTLPAGLRPLAAASPAIVYAALFAAASSTLQRFAQRRMQAELGLCAVLHTHNRRLDLHPHVHIVLSRYLYRGVIQERNLTAYDPIAQTVSFRYRDSGSGQWAFRTLPIADFLWKLLLHVLPSGFRRVRDYGFLHGRAKARLGLVQLILRVIIPARPPRPRPMPCCPHCQMPMVIIGFTPRRPRDG